LLQPQKSDPAFALRRAVRFTISELQTGQCGEPISSNGSSIEAVVFPPPL
jgi:hypothetical protein